MSSSSTETLVDVTMPQMGVSVAEGTVVEWKKQPGDWVQADEIIASISTDKIDTDVEAPATGRVQELIVEVGATVEVGTVLARIATDAKPGEAHRSENAESAGADSARNPLARIPRSASRRAQRGGRGSGCPGRGRRAVRATPRSPMRAARSAARRPRGGPARAATRPW